MSVAVEFVLFSNASQVSCESTEDKYWNVIFQEVKTCKMRQTTSIDSQETTVLTKDDLLGAIIFWGNRNIKFLPVRLSDAFPNLMGYSAIACSLTQIIKANFENLGKLKCLYLAHNQISTIETASFQDLTALEVLDLGSRK
jgi:hypothetical protein